MLKSIIFMAALLCGTQASAQDCPTAFRFADFGLQDQSGNFARGGPLFRAESFSRIPLLIKEDTQCRDVRDLTNDLFGLPIPVVTQITYDVRQIGVELKELQVSFTQDARTATDKNAKVHQDRLAASRVEPMRGPNSLCAVSEDAAEISCQVVSPFPGNMDLVIYCDPQQCRMPVLAIGEQLQVSSKWAVSAGFLDTPEQAGEKIFRKVQNIHAFLTPISSGL